ncbi:hypothetical protein [Corynebacterium resistens]|nr:hypothetical protein [Corynebacterium resistens]
MPNADPSFLGGLSFRKEGHNYQDEYSAKKPDIAAEKRTIHISSGIQGD